MKSGCKFALNTKELKRGNGVEYIFFNFFKRLFIFIGYQQLLRGLKLLKPLEEDDWKAVFEKTAGDVPRYFTMNTAQILHF